nr:MAG TPA: hypothetical protein [Caudoviricetes sp.]
MAINTPQLTGNNGQKVIKSPTNRNLSEVFYMRGD